jgi:hypothetical protein
MITKTVDKEIELFIQQKTDEYYQLLDSNKISQEVFERLIKAINPTPEQIMAFDKKVQEALCGLI